ncbi:tetratricopeptide repeat protein [Acuticoccus sp. MNP-M23]|uniref:tetratricopeptide repeat protein n=1 Tax=Acuticoccus sp. MNP-M23 TaxID=3072793 RepID=UPI0028157BAB|nr:tetratricopeptide repeat protein [Acuticoccus sp. MNP-M23]WMS41022.1 tetratricopeptide repeat protein [Acuticoccus sp. MNP-M23]
MTARADAPVPASLAHVAGDWQGLVTSFMAHSARVPDRLAALGEAAPSSPAFLAAKGLLFMLLGRRELATEAGNLLTAARAGLAAHGGLADRQMVEALAAFIAGRPSRSAQIFDEMQVLAPGDGFALKMAQAIRFLYGDTAGMRRSADAAIGGFADEHPHAGYARGCFAFACEEVGDLALAERAGIRALELAPDDAWALHAVAHVHEMRGQPEKGRDWLAPRQSAFAGCSNFAHHVWWHSALFELDLGNVDMVLDLYDTEIRREHTDDYRDIANAVSLLARVEAEGIEVGTRWDELAAIAERRVDDACIVFADLHYLMALLASGRQDAADRLIERMAGAGDGSEFGAVAAGAGAAAGGGLAAMRRGHHEDALIALRGARAQMQTIGGSHAQRDVFERLTIDAALKAGCADEARAIIKDRAQKRGAFDRFGYERLLRCGPPAVEAPASTSAAF